jgi:hypothetical protein
MLAQIKWNDFERTLGLEETPPLEERGEVMKVDPSTAAGMTEKREAAPV